MTFSNRFFLWRRHSRIDIMLVGLASIFDGLVSLLTLGTFGHNGTFVLTARMAENTWAKEDRKKGVDT